MTTALRAHGGEVDQRPAEAALLGENADGARTTGGVRPGQLGRVVELHHAEQFANEAANLFLHFQRT